MANKRKPPALSLALVLDDYERDLRRQRIAEKTILGYHKIHTLVQQFLETKLGHVPTLDDFTLGHIEHFLDHLLERGNLRSGEPLSPETLRTYMRALKAFSSWLAAEKQSLTPSNCLKLLRLPRPTEEFEMPLEVEEMQQLLSACDLSSSLGARDVAMLMIFLDGGLRAMDLAKLKVSDVNTESGQLFIASGKGEKTRIVTVGAETCRALRRYVLYRDSLTPAGPQASFFQTQRGGPFKYDGLKQWFRRLQRRAGITRRLHLHLLRHTSAVQTLDVPGSDLFTLQMKLGHADISTTRRYLRMTGKKLSDRQRTFSPLDHLGMSGLKPPIGPQKKEQGKK